MLLVLLMRHGESQANATREDLPDPELTTRGAAQADAWRQRAARWDLETVLVSPLLRCVQTAARAFGACESGAWRLCPAAREHWWHMAQSRGRLGAGLAPFLDALPPCGLAARDVFAAVGEPSEHWDPDDEATQSKRELGRRAARATLALVTDLARRAAAGERRVVVVCHWGVLAALADADADNCDVVGLLFAPHAPRVGEAPRERKNVYKDAARALGFSYDVLGPWKADGPRIPLLEHRPFVAES